MLSSGLPPVFLLLTALELSWSLSDEEKQIILDGHNKYRSQVSPPAMDMLKMVSGFSCRGMSEGVCVARASILMLGEFSLGETGQFLCRVTARQQWRSSLNCL